MRKIKEIPRLRYEAGLSLRGVSQSLNIGYGTVVDYINRAEQANISWPINSSLDERDLGLLLFPTQPAIIIVAKPDKVIDARHQP